LGLIENILSEMGGMNKARLAFMRWLFAAWLGLPVRHTFLNLARFGPYCDKTLRLQMARAFDFARFCQLLIDKCCGAQRISAFDPSFVEKAGKQTYGVDSWWCGTLQKVRRGLELGVLGIVDVEARSAFALKATQTPAMEKLREQKQSLMEHYISIVKGQEARLKALGVRVVTADAYFAKAPWVEAIVAMGLVAVTRLRMDANLNSLYNGPQKKRGRPKEYAGKVDCKKIDKRRLRLFQQDADSRYYSGVVYSVALERQVRIVYIEQRHPDKKHNNKKSKKNRAGLRYCILMSSDVELAAEKIAQYYQLRFQIEFLIRDAKSHAGLQECQARDKEKLDFHFNLALSCVSWAKATFWLPGAPEASAPEADAPEASAPEKRGAFSLHNIKLLFTSELWAQRVFQNLGFDPTLDKYKHAYARCLDTGGIAV
jgi:hypothetical protein